MYKYAIYIHVCSFLLQYTADLNYLYISAFSKVCVPCFAIIMGFVFRSSTDIKKTWKKNVFRIILPLILFSIFYDVFHSWVIGNFTISFPNLIHIFSTDVLASNAFHLWYLYAIVGIYLLFPILKIICARENKKVKVYCIVVLLILEIVFPFLENITGTNWFVNLSYTSKYSYLLLYFFIGNYFKDKIDTIKDWKFIYLILYILIIILSIIYYQRWEIRFNPFILFSYSFNYQSIFVFLASIFLFLFVMKIHINKDKIILYLGGQTLGTFFIHLAFVYIYLHLFSKLNIENVWVYPIIITILVYVTSVIVILICKKIIRKFLRKSN